MMFYDLCCLTLIRVLEKKWIAGTYEVNEFSKSGHIERIEITNINAERWQALVNDILPNTSPVMKAEKHGKTAVITFY